MFKPALTLLLSVAIAPIAPLHASASEPAATREVAIRELQPLAPTDAKLATAPRRSAPRSAHRIAIDAVREAGATRVTELVAALEPLPEGPAREALNRQIEQVKQETRLSVLRLHLAHAQQKGDASRAAEAQRLIDLMMNPPAPKASQVSRPVPSMDGGKQ